MKSLLALLVLGIGLAIFPACGDDSAGPERGIPEPPAFKNLSQKWHVLNNMELAYRQRQLVKYDELLDNNFVFYLTAGDVGSGLPDAWDRTVEMQASTHLFSRDPPAQMPRCKSISMDIQWEDNLNWVEVTPSNSDETWYTATVFFSFKVEVEPDLTFISNPGTKAQFTVRNAGTDNLPHWQLVEMRDLGSSSGPSTTSMSTEPATWGAVKAIYR